jgi:uncharacterized membrane protein YkvA (DUF1232 family)
MKPPARPVSAGRAFSVEGDTAMFETIRTLILCGTLLAVAFLVLVSLPQSKLRDLLMPFVGWGVAALSVAYVIMPLDVLPDFIPVAGWIDDIGALALAFGSARAAMTAAKKLPQLLGNDDDDDD